MSIKFHLPDFAVRYHFNRIFLSMRGTLSSIFLRWSGDSFRLRLLPPVFMERRKNYAGSVR